MYQVTDALYISQLEEQLSHIRMGEEETASDYCNQARRILATMRMASMHYLTASYLMHVIKGLMSSYNLLKRLSLAPTERPLELLAQVNYVASVKQGGRPGQRGQSGGGGSSGWKSMDADKKKSAKDSGQGGGRGNKQRKEKQSTKLTSAMDADSSAGGKGRDDKEVSCLLVGVVESTVSLAPEVGEDFHAMAAAVQANPEVVLLDSGCSHHLMGTKAAFVDLGPSGDVKHVRGFNGALQDVSGRGTVALQGEDEKQVLIADVLYVPGVRANLLSTGQLKENGVKLQEDGGMMLLVSAAGDVLGRASYTGRVLCTDLRPRRRSWPCGSVKHEVATGLDLKSALGTDSPCVLCVGRKLARHTFLDQGSDAADMLAVVHIDLCGPFCVAAKDGSLYFLLLKDRKTRYVWVRPVAKKSDMLLEFQKGVPREAAHQLRGWQGDHPRPDLPLHPAVERHGGAGDAHGGGVGEDDATAHGRAAPLVAPRSGAGYLGSQLPGAGGAAAEDNAVLAFLVLEQQRGGKLKPKARWGLHLSMSAESKGSELLDIANNRVVSTSGVVFYENMLLEVWKSEHGPALGRTPTTPTATHPLLAEVGEPAAEDVEDFSSPSPSPAPPALSLKGSAADDGEVGKGGSGTAAVDRGAGSGEADHGAVGDWAVSRGADLRGAAGGDADHDAARCWG
ncbi:unnamed protein product [Closterium sp. NIES-53]